MGSRNPTRVPTSSSHSPGVVPPCGSVGLLLLALIACGAPEAPPSAPPEASPPSSRGFAQPAFEDRAAELGVDFLHVNDATGEFRVPEILGPGVGLFDADGDGDLDLYFPQGGALEPAPLPNRAMPEGRDAPRDRLYRNLLIETGELRFEDATAESGILATGYGMGLAVGDVDGDGDLDLFLANYGADQLWRNEGDGTFVEIPDAGGADDPRWNVPATFFDADRDGDLDLFVGAYIDYGPATHKDCFAESSALDYCGPKSYLPLPDRLYLNRGDGTFEDVSIASRIATVAGPTLGVAAADVDGDGWTDLYVAHDDVANALWRNLGDGTFENRGLISGSALNELGQAESSMGVDAADYDDDGDLDLFMTHIREETNTLYRNDGSGLFTDVSTSSGLGPASLGATGFGTGWTDVDNDGRLDLFSANGAVRLDLALAASGDPFPFRQRNQVFRHLAGGRFHDATDTAGPGLEPVEISRGAAFGDLDDDGDEDIVVANNGARPRILINSIGADRAWLGLRLVGPSGLEVPGAIARLRLADGRELWRRARRDGSYASANDPRVRFGLGASGRPDELTVYWPDGLTETWSGAELATGRYSEVLRGTGREVPR